ncbi:hypothetical protein [Aquimonas sp.]|uniref:hypothetical protein n=1 Tax=Aquimonas sp. TaxID=1872588 RepID=UPI0037BF9411
MSIYLLSVVIGIGLLSGPPPPPAEEPPPIIMDRVETIDTGWIIRSEDLDAYTERAMKGDPESALRIALHFSTQFVGDRDASSYWMLIAAENGHPIAQYNVWYEYNRSDSAQLKLRSMYWLRRSAESGNRLAQEQLRALEQIESRSNRPD